MTVDGGADYPEDPWENDTGRDVRRWGEIHSGHEITLRSQLRPNGLPYRWCRTCDRRYEIDEVAVQRAVSGDRAARLTRAERHKAVRQLRPKLSTARIARQLGVTDRTVWRDLADIRRNKQPGARFPGTAPPVASPRPNPLPRGVS